MKRIALINDLSGFGKCSLTAGIPVVSAMGIQACPLPTAILSAQTGFDKYFCDDYTDKMNEITDCWNEMDVDFDGICSGYLGSPTQIKSVLYFLEKFKKENTTFLADPVMGDNGRCIKSYSKDLLDTMKELTRHAEVITPNLTELCLLTDTDYEKLGSYESKEALTKCIYEKTLALISSAFGNQTIIVTGIVREEQKQSYVGNLVATVEDYKYYESPYTGMSFSGTGDLFASVVIGAIVRGQSTEEAVKLAMKFLQPAIEEATNDKIEKNHGIHFEKYLCELIG